MNANPSAVQTASWTQHAVLTVEEMAAADRLALDRSSESFVLMEAAGAAAAKIAQARFGQDAAYDILCGPGNNGGDGYVAARLLRDAGCSVSIWTEAEPTKGDARRAFEAAATATRPLSSFQPERERVVIDALFGAGLSRPLDGDAASACRRVREAGCPVFSVDLPAGLSGNTGEPLGEAFRATVTVTFARKKPAHLLYPGRERCGEVVVADIGIPDAVIAQLSPALWENQPDLWRHIFPWPAENTHKYNRGHLAVCSGGPFSSGAARLSAMAGARIGAGATTLLSPSDALAVNAAHLNAIMLHSVDAPDEVQAFLTERRCRAAILGPGFGDFAKAHGFALAVLGCEDLKLVLDADGISAFRDRPKDLFEAAGRSELRLVLTPHEGEFARLFPDLAENKSLSKVEKTRQAAARAHAIVILKGFDTVIAEPTGRAAINANATPFLATAGSGDVLAGICGGLLAQNMPIWEAACAAVWTHAEAGRCFGPGLTADDLPDALLPVLRQLRGET